MPKTRAYTRDELQGLRRADLQRLCKTYNIKGANAKSDILVTTLADYFTSPEYLASQPQTDESRSRPPSRQPARPLHGPGNRAPSRAQPAASRPQSAQAVASAPPRSARPTRPASVAAVASATGRSEAPRASHTAITNGPSQRRAPSRAVAKKQPTVQESTQPSLPSTQPPQPPPHRTAPPAAPSNTPPDLPSAPSQPQPQPVIPTSTQSPSQMTVIEASSRNQVPPRINSGAPGLPSDEVASLRAEISQLREAVAKFDDEAFLQRLEKRIEDRIQAALAEQLAAVKAREEAVAAQEAALADTLARIEAFQHKMLGGSIAQVDEPAVLPSPQEGALKRKELESDLPQPIQKRMRLPSDAHTTPSMSSAKVSEAPSTPDSSRNLAGPRTPPPPPRGASVDHASTPGRELSPRGLLPFPGGARSPTVDRPDRPRLPGRAKRARRSLSQAHMDLSAITESEPEAEPESGPSRRPFLGSIAIDRSTVTPPALSPSPRIGGDNFTYTPLPPPFARDGGSSSSATSPQMPRPKSRFEPQRAYMDIALNGFPDNYSPSGQATPGSRTMLGTERFRDNRFADEPLVSWPSPRLDYGPETPTNHPTTRHFE